MSAPLPHLIARFHERPRQLTAVTFKRSGSWLKWDWGEYQAHIERTYGVLKELGIRAGDRVAIMSTNSVEWALCDFANLCLGSVTVPIYPNCSDEDLKLILEETQPQLIFLESSHLVSRFPKSWGEKFVFLKPNPEPNSRQLWSLLNSLTIEDEKLHQDFINSCREKTLDELATIVYTSGTSGKPKGICLNHRQIVSELKDVSIAFPITSQDLTLSFLPYAHILGRVEMWLAAYAGFTLAFSESMEKIKLNILEVKPTVLIAVPRIFEKIYTSVISKLNSHYLFRFLERHEDKNLFTSLGLAPLRIILQNQVQSQLREALGGRLKYAISGGAPLSKDVAEFFRRCDVLLLEGYGLTETTGAICVNTPEHHHFGTVGKPLADVKIKLGEDNEILVRSEKLFDRPFKPQDDGRKDTEGFFATGDIGEWTPEGFLRITDRKKDLIKTSGGKYVAPQRIENLFKKYPLISYVLVHGDQRKFITALITLDPNELKTWALENSIPFSKVTDLVHSPAVEKKVEETVRLVNGELASFESIKNFLILDREFTVENGELTPSLKVRRRFVEEKYKEELERLYGI